MDCSIKSRIFQLLLNLFYPPLCLHCQALLSNRQLLFCPICLEQISLIDAKERCRTCFAEIDRGKCNRCIKRKVVIQHQIAACEMFGPAKTILNGIQSGKRECIPAAASLMAYQWLEMKMPLPDFLVPLPSRFLEKQRWGFDPKFLLAFELSKIFAVPVKSILQKKFDRELFLTKGEFQHRVQLSKRKKEILCDRSILIVVPILDDAQLRSIGKELKMHFPAQIDVLAFAAFDS
jgi:predicted amidophosphoribosyltransferase